MLRDRVEVLTDFAALTVTILGTAFFAHQQITLISTPFAATNNPTQVEITLTSEPPAAPPPSPPEQQKPPPEPPKPLPHPQKVQPPPEPVRRKLPDQPTPQPDQPVEAVAVSPPVPPSKAAAFDLPPGPASQPPLNHDLESAYLSGLRAYIDSRTSPPDTAEYRLLHPHGEAVVRFTLSRLGAVHDVSIAKSSGSPMLDEQARTIVAGGNYPPFPAETYRSETEHVFTVHIEFRPGTHGVL